MKKIMFNDKYGLTQAVLEGRKTQTRRIAFKQNGFIIIEDKDIHLQKLDNGLCSCMFGDYKFITAKYRIGETLAIAQRYADITSSVDWANCIIRKEEIGWNNKMFVRADLMPHHIRITRIRVERLQDISEEDCLAEGIWEAHNIGLEGVTYWYTSLINSPYRTAKEAYAALIDKISGKGTWKSNPYVFVYDFELI